MRLRVRADERIADDDCRCVAQLRTATLGQPDDHCRSEAGGRLEDAATRSSTACGRSPGAINFRSYRVPSVWAGPRRVVPHDAEVEGSWAQARRKRTKSIF